MKIISKIEKFAWERCKNHFYLVDIGVTRQLTWENYGARKMLRKACLERCYISQEFYSICVAKKCNALF